MRSILALSLLITLCASANAASVHHAHRRHAIVRPNPSLPLGYTVPGWAYAPAGPRVQYGPAPEDDQPSVYDNRFKNWGG